MTSRPLCSNNRIRKGLLALSSLLAVISLEAQALGLGKLTVTSHLGEKFSAKIALSNPETAKDFTESCLRLAPPTYNEDVPRLKNAVLRLESSAQGSKIAISTGHPIYEPILEVSIQIQCGIELTRTYTVLLDPPEATTQQLEQQTPPPQPPDRKSARPAAPPTQQAATLEAPPERLNKKQQVTPVKTEARRQATEKTTDRLTLSGGEPADNTPEAPLSLQLDLNIRHKATASEEKRALLRSQYQLITSLGERAAQQLSISEQLVALDQKIADLLSTNEQTEQRLREKAQVIPATPTAPAAQPEPAATATAPHESTNTLRWLIIAAATAAAGMIGVLVFRKRRAKSTEPAESTKLEEPEFESPITRSPASPRFEDPQTMWVDKAELEPLPDTSLNAQTQPVSPVTLPPAPPSTMDILIEDTASLSGEAGELSTTLELVEIMITFGKFDDARLTLEEYIQRHHEAPVEIWLRLLAIDCQQAKRSNFDLFFERFIGEFNISDISVDDAYELMSKAQTWTTEFSGQPPYSLDHFANLRANPALFEQLSQCQDEAALSTTITQLLTTLRTKHYPPLSLSALLELETLLKQLSP